MTVVAGFILPVPAFAEEPVTSPISTETRVNERHVTIGDLVTYSIIVRHDPEIRVSPPVPPAQFAKGFQYVDQGTGPSRTLNGQTEDIFWFKYRADRTGFYNIPKIPVRFTSPLPDDPSQTIPGTIQAPATVIEIHSVLYQDGEPLDIKDIKPIIGADPAWQRYLQWLIAGLAGLLALFGFFRWFFNSKQVSPPAPKAPPLRPDQIARMELDRLMSKNLIGSGQYRLHYFELSEIFRRYLGAWLNIPALDWTSEEIRAHLSTRAALDSGLKNRILSLLMETDRVKFAKAPVDNPTAIDHVASVRQLVRETAPKESTPAKAVQAA